MTFVETAEGPIEILRQTGKIDGGTIVLLHGIQGTSLAWDGVVGHLDKGRTIVRPNLRGRGGSLSPETSDAYSLKSFARDLRATLETVDGPVLLVGWSMGVLVALTYIDEYGLKGVEGLILASGTSHPAGEAVWFSGQSLAEIEEEASERARRLNLPVFASAVAVAGAWASVREVDMRRVLPEISVPTLVMHGTHDDQCPLAHGQAIAASIPGARLEIWKDHGHNLMTEDARRFAATIDGLARSLPSTNMCAANQ